MAALRPVRWRAAYAASATAPEIRSRRVMPPPVVKSPIVISQRTGGGPPPATSEPRVQINEVSVSDTIHTPTRAAERRTTREFTRFYVMFRYVGPGFWEDVNERDFPGEDRSGGARYVSVIADRGFSGVLP